MTRQIALLRAVNVGGRKLPMADLRASLETSGFADVVTYIQSGNIVFTPPPGGTSAEKIDALIHNRFSLNVDSVVLNRRSLSAIINRNPYRNVVDQKSLHVLFSRNAISIKAKSRLSELLHTLHEKGCSEQATIIGSACYLELPGGMGRSELAPLLGRGGAAAITGTVRNWATVNKLLELSAP